MLYNNADKIITLFLLFGILAGAIEFADATPSFMIEPIFISDIADDSIDPGSAFDTLDGATYSASVVIDGSVYVVITSFSTASGFTIADISDPANPQFVSRMRDNGANGGGDVDKYGIAFTSIEYGQYVTIATIDGVVYALIGTYDHNEGIQIVDISDPYYPLYVADIRNHSEDSKGNSFDNMDIITALITVVIDGATYAIATSFLDDSITIIDISNPADPLFVSDYRSAHLDTAVDVSTVVIDGDTYALVSYALGFIKVFDISDPYDLKVVNDIWHTDSDINGKSFTSLAGLTNVHPIVIDGATYALVPSWANDGFSIFDISNLTSPLFASSVVDGDMDRNGNVFDQLDGAITAETIVIDGATYAIVGATFDDGIQIIDISNPYDILAAGSFTDNVGGFDLIDGVTNAVTVVIDGVVYVLVTSAYEDSLTLVDISSQVSIGLDPLQSYHEITYSGSGTLKVDLSTAPFTSGEILIPDLLITTPDVEVSLEGNIYKTYDIPSDDKSIIIAPSKIIPPGFSNVDMIIEIGKPGIDIAFNHPLKLTLFNQAGNLLYYIDAADVIYPITIACDGNTFSEINLQFDTDGITDCYLDDGTDLINWTNHFSHRVTVNPDGTSTTDDDNPSGGSGNQWNTRPTFGISHETYNQIVDDGFAFNNNTFTVTDNHHTPFDRQNVTLGELNSFSAKVYAINTLHIQEFLFGIPNVGEAHKAELGVEVYYDMDGAIIDTKLVQKTNVVDPITFNATGSKVKCQESDVDEYCYITNISMVFLEPLIHDVMSIKAIDYEKRYQMTFLNDGFNIDGTSLNPMIQSNIPGPEKYEGPIIVTQSAKYSDIWIAEDGREFERNESGTFTHINNSYTRHQDPGDAKNRLHSDYVLKQQYEIKRASVILADICPRCNDVSYDKINNIITITPTPTHRNYDTQLHEWKNYEAIRAEYTLDKIIKETYSNNPFYKDFRK